MGLNVLGGTLQACNSSKKTGILEDGRCSCIGSDTEQYLVCAVMTDEFLEYSSSIGNDLQTPSRGHKFPGLKPGEKWCLGVALWVQAFEDGYAPPIYLAGTHMGCLEFIDLIQLKKYAID